jgi:hypothetical protein
MLKLVFPPKLAGAITSISGDLDSISDEASNNRTIYLSRLIKLERVLDSSQRYLRKKNLEASPQYLTEFRRYEKSDWLGYIIKSESAGTENTCLSGQIQLPANTKVFSVTTPIWLVLHVVKVKGKLKIIRLMMYDD